jgi:hypothetical protein
MKMTFKQADVLSGKRLSLVMRQARARAAKEGYYRAYVNGKLKTGQSFVEAMEEEEAERNREIRAPLRRTTEAVDLFDRSRLTWLQTGGIFRLSIGDGQAVVCLRQSEGYDVFLVAEDRAATPLVKQSLPLEYALGTAEDYARRNARVSFIDKNASWRNGLATTKQLDLLARLGVPTEGGVTKGRAQELISRVMDGPPTEKQVVFIRRNGLHRNPLLLTKKQARTLIAQYYERRSA